MGSRLIIATILCALSNSAVSATWSDLEVGDLVWDEPIGLWSSLLPGDPSTRIHETRFQAGNLLLAARYGLADAPEIELVLQALSDMQVSYGTIRTRYEDAGFTDGNTSFFVCSDLLLLRYGYSSELSTTSIAILDDMFTRFHNRFHDRSIRYLDQQVHYANAFMGDLINAKIIEELLSMSASVQNVQKTQMLKAAKYWRDNEWGWGEHLSDVYAMVSADLISQYLLFTTDGSQEQVRQEYADLLEELLYIEDGYGGNPRVPAIRSYAFTSRSGQTNYRDSIVAWDPNRALTTNHFWRDSYLREALFYEHDWHSIAPPRYSTMDEMRTPCINGTVAMADIEDDIRLGSMSKYPIMPEMEGTTWGLLWQSFPVALWKSQGDWGFLQWQTVENGVIAAHPAHQYGAPASLSAIDPSIQGSTYSFQTNGNALVVRMMPEIPGTWDSVTDQFKIVNKTATLSEGTSSSAFKQLLMTYPERTVSVGFSSLVTTPSTAISYDGNAAFWGMTYTSNQLASAGMVLDVFGISLNGEMTELPVISTIDPIEPARTLQEQKRNIVWNWADGSIWRATVDPLAVDVLQMEEITFGPPPPTPAGEITFGAKTEVLNDAAGSSVLTNGAYVIAGNVRGGLPVSVNGVTFNQLNLNGSVTGNGVTIGLEPIGTLNNGAKPASYTTYTENAGLGALLYSSYESDYGGDGMKLNLSGLTVGQEYQLQGLYWDDVKTFKLSDENDASNSAVYATETPTKGHSWMATWVAEASSKTIEFTPLTRATLGAVSLRLIYTDHYYNWISLYPASGSETNLTDNPDGDALNNLAEWALGGNPVDGDDVGYIPTSGTTEDGGGGWFEYIYAKRNNAATLGLTYYLEQCTNLLSGAWTNGNYEVVGAGVLDGEFDTVTNRVPIAAEDQQFLHLIIEHN